VEAVRPSQCPACGAAGRPAGAGVGIQGHGLRERQQRGPVEAGGPATMVIVMVRRYLCRCGATLTVTPAETRHGRLYTASAIGAALALFGVKRLPARTVRAAISPWRVVGVAASTGWVTLRRWISAVRARVLFTGAVPSTPADFTARQVAERAAMALAAHAPPDAGGPGIIERVFEGVTLVS